MTTGATQAVRTSAVEALLAGSRTWITLHEWDWALNAHLDRLDGLYGPQLANREPVDESGRAVVVLPYPEQVTAHFVLWRDGVPMLHSDPVHMGPGDTLKFDARRDTSFS